MLKKSNKKKTVFISGSSSGIGLGIAKVFAEQGYKVGLNGVNKLRLIKAQNLILNSEIFNYDLIDQKKIQIFKKEIKKKFKKIDILICNLGNSNFDKNHENISGAF
jgi:NADP-dependent 3-hydroxy acid dehydrogenase YdfG